MCRKRKGGKCRSENRLVFSYGFLFLFSYGFLDKYLEYNTGGIILLFQNRNVNKLPVIFFSVDVKLLCGYEN